MSDVNHSKILISETKPAVVTIENSGGRAPVLVTCDHASNLVPESLANLGLNDHDLQRHIAYDIGALDLSKAIADRLDAPLIHSGYSRLVIDLNRHLDDPSCIPIISEGTEIPGNHPLNQDQRQTRIDELFSPYHQKFAQTLDEFQARGIHPVILAIHTFTPVYHGIDRPWHTGVMWDTDDRMALPFMDNLNMRGDLIVGNNQPYTALDPLGYAFDIHARKRGLPHLFIEVRQDLVTDEVGVMRWATIIHQALEPLLDDQHIYSILEQA